MSLRVVSLTLCATVLAVGCAEPLRQTDSWQTFGREAEAVVWTHTRPTGERLLASFRQATEKVAAEMDGGRPDTELSRLNAAAGSGYHSLDGHRDLYRCIRLALDYARASDGTYDPTRDWTRVATEREALAVKFLDPDLSLDLSGIAPGYALDVAARNFATPGSIAGLLRLDGHAYAWQSPPGEAHWNVTMPDPRSSGSTLLSVRVVGRGLAVAAGRPGESDVSAALAIADSVADADAISEALVAGGSRRAGALLSKTRRVEAVLFLDHRVLASASLEGRLEGVGPVRWLLPPSEL